MIFATLMNYQALFATAEYAFMRPFEHPLVILGPTLQIFRGALLALAFLPFRKVLVKDKRGWVYLLIALWVLMHVGADAADPGKIEGFIYADFGAATHFATWPESIFSSLTFAWLFHTWMRRPKDKRLSIPLIGVLVITVAVAVLGLLFMGAG
jgi:DMSO reductase anchor subunit